MEKGLEMVTSDDWLRGFAIMSKMFGVTENDLDEIKQKFDAKYKTEILTDIRDYLVERKAECGNEKCEINQIMGLGVKVFIDKALADLAEYAEKLGVEL